MAKKRRKPKPKPKPKPRATREADKLAGMRMLIRQAAKSGAAEAIEHCANFWSVSDGYKKYIDHQIATEADALLAAVRLAVRAELGLAELAQRRRKK